MNDPPPLVFEPTTLQLFRFSAATWNSHLIHYDRDYAHTEGYPDVLVQSHLHGCFLMEVVRRWADGRGELRRFSWQNRHFARPGDVLTCSGHIVDTEDDLVSLELEERNQEDQVCATGSAVVALTHNGKDGS
jgi:hydroxyacyl-ACP dehydratase HTD2-like protein with hotdog domain